ncbi:hypothetical protein [Clostridium sp.]|uniref:hypothetical protein n=1 Tax=Clostridium sp. TaxID=1506 RepID=UPI00303A148D
MLTIFYDSLTELEWFIELNPIFEDAEFCLILNKGKNPEAIEKLLQYDKPDIILLHNNIPVLVLEKTSEVPTGHNVGQRFARLVKGIEEGVLTIYYFPFDARKHGANTSICNLNIRLLDACFKIQNIHNVPLLVVDWISDDNGELIYDGSENIRLIEIIHDFIQSDFNYNCPEVNKQLNIMQNEYIHRLNQYPAYGEMPASVVKYNTDEFISIFSLTNVPDKFRSKSYTYVYKINMSPGSCKRQDPYTGTQLIYDYMVCRNGELTSDKHNNLVLYFPSLDEDLWFSKNPNNSNTKSSNWYITASALLFKNNDIHYNIL